MSILTAEPGTRTKRRIALLAGAIVFVMLAGAIMLWAHLGTAVFLEAIRAGIAYCF